MRNLFYEDVEKGSAVFALPRTGNINEIRDAVITLPTDSTHPAGYWQPAGYDTPAKFLELLKDTSMTSTKTRANVFLSYRGAPPDTVTTGTVTSYVTNGSIFILRPSDSPTQLWMQALYEIDYIGFTDLKDTSRYSTGMPCVHASVRRYAWDLNKAVVLSHFYDVVFRDSTLADVGVPVGCGPDDFGVLAVFSRNRPQGRQMVSQDATGVSRLVRSGSDRLSDSPKSDTDDPLGRDDAARRRLGDGHVWTDSQQ